MTEIDKARSDAREMLGRLRFDAADASTVRDVQVRAIKAHWARQTDGPSVAKFDAMTDAEIASYFGGLHDAVLIERQRNDAAQRAAYAPLRQSFEGAHFDSSTGTRIYREDESPSEGTNEAVIAAMEAYQKRASNAWRADAAVNGARDQMISEARRRAFGIDESSITDTKFQNSNARNPTGSAVMKPIRGSRRAGKGN